MSGVLKLAPPPDTDINYSSAIGEFTIGLSPIQGWPAVAVTPLPYSPAMTPHIQRFYDSIQVDLPGVTIPMIDNELENTINEFCFRSTFFREEVYWQMQPGISQVELNPFSMDMVTVWVIDQQGLLQYHVNPPATLVDDYPPTAQRSGSAVIVLKPKSRESVMRGAVLEMFTNWFEVTLDGTLARLYASPAKPWSNQQATVFHGTRFKAGLNRARDVAERLNSSQQSRFRRFPYFARGRRKN